MEEAVPDDWSTLAGRLTWAIRQHQPRRGKERGVRLFQRRMEARRNKLLEAGQKLEGGSLSSIQTYLNGSVIPPLPFLREAAQLLNVREAWLITGDGAVTEADAAEAELLGPAGAGLAQSISEQQRRVERALNEGAGASLPLRKGPLFFDPEPVLFILMRLVTERCRVGPRAERTEREVRVARKIGRAVTAPLRELGLELQYLSYEFLEDHLFAMAPILRRTIEEGLRQEEEGR